MAYWNVSDELDARLREQFGVEDPAAFVERLVSDHLDAQDDDNPAVRAIVQADLAASEVDIAAGRVTEARHAMREIGEKHGLDFDR